MHRTFETKGMASLHPLLLTIACALHVRTVQGVTESVAAILRDHPSAAANLFNSMRTPAALVAGAVVPLGILTAPPIRANEPRKVKLFKKLNILLAVSSLLSEVLAITYSTVAMNNLAGFARSEPTKSVAELISRYFEVSWLGTNVHFLFGLFGLCLLVGSKAHMMYGDAIGRIATCLSLSAFLQSVSVVNRGISQGGGTPARLSLTRNFFGLGLKYIKLVIQRSNGNVLSIAAIGLFAYSLYLTLNMFAEEQDNFELEMDERWS